MSNRRVLWPAALLAVSAWMVPGLTAAQTLSAAMCPAGSPFNLQPTFTTFLAGQPGIPLLRRTIDTAVYPEARCNDGSAAVMYIRPANAAYGGNPIVNNSSKWVIFLDGGGGCQDTDQCLLERWCGGGGQVFDRAGKMSSLGAQAAIHGFGIFELAPLEPPLASPGVQGINCSRHVAIQTNDGFFRHQVIGAGLPARSFHDLLVAWLAGAPSGPNTVQIQTDLLGAGAYSPSFCP
jgi:hypothetical protein